jgi:hypothetical protein
LSFAIRSFEVKLHPGEPATGSRNCGANTRKEWEELLRNTNGLSLHPAGKSFEVSIDISGPAIFD